VICVPTEFTLKIALFPPNVTLVTPVKLVPSIVTEVPTGPLAGLKLLMVGACKTVKLAPLVAIPPTVVTEIGPLVATEGTVAMIFMPLNLKLALAPLKATCVAPFRLLPLMVTALPTPPTAGEKLAIVGGRFETTLNAVPVVAEPPPVVTVIKPLVAPDGTVAVICVSEFTAKLALVLLKVTRVAPVKAVPAIVTAAPIPPLAGLKLAIVGAGIKVKLLLLVTEPPPVVTPSGPVTAFVGTVALICVSELTVKLAFAPPKATCVAPVRPEPVMVMDFPAAPLVGVKLVIAGGAVTLKLVELLPLPATVVTEMGPVVTPLGAEAVICVSELTVVDAALVPLKATVLAAVNPVPVIVTEVPATPLGGVNEVIVGAPNTNS
jgi:hypothetical protein